MALLLIVLKKKVEELKVKKFSKMVIFFIVNIFSTLTYNKKILVNLLFITLKKCGILIFLYVGIMFFPMSYICL